MAWPPPVLPINRTNADQQQNTHPADHNAISLAINDTVAKVKEKTAQLWLGTPNAVTLPANGVLGYFGGVTIPAVPYRRQMDVTVRGLCISLAAGGYSDMYLLAGGTQVARARTNGIGNPVLYYVHILEANTSIMYAVNVSGNANATWSADTTYAREFIEAHAI